MTVSIIEDQTNRMAWSCKVLGKEGQCVLIRNGGVFYRMHPCHLKKIKSFEVQEMKKIKFLQMR